MRIFWKIGDIILIVGLIIFFAMVKIYPFYRTGTEDADKFYVVEMNGAAIIKEKLDPRLSSRRHFKVKQIKAELQIDRGRLRLLRMPKEVCPDGICSASGWIQKPGETIVCVPNKLMIRVAGGNTDYDFLLK